MTRVREHFKKREQMEQMLLGFGNLDGNMAKREV